MRLPGFVGPSNVLRSRNVSPQEVINAYIERVDAGTPKVDYNYYRRPRLTPFVRLASAPVRGIWGQDGRAFAVSGNTFYEVFASQNATERGTVAVDNNPATIVSNGAGNQLFIVSGGVGYIYDLLTDTLTSIAGGFVTPALMGGFLNSLFLSLKGNSQQFNWSAILDGTTWDSLDFAVVSQTPDVVRCLLVSHGTVWLFGSQNTAVWWNSASGNTVFEPVDSARITMGIAGPWCACNIDNTIYWLSENQDGGRVVMRADGYTPVRVSTHAIEFYLDALPTVADAICWTYQDNGHTFWLLYCPQAEHTLVYDVSSQMWTKWSMWDPTQLRHYPYLGRCHTYIFNTHLVGDRQSGTIYEQVLEPGNDSFIMASGL